jgi:transposase
MRILKDHERKTLCEVQCRVAEHSVYVKDTAVLMLIGGRSLTSVSDDLGIDLATVYRYAQAFSEQGPSRLSATAL